MGYVTPTALVLDDLVTVATFNQYTVDNIIAMTPVGVAYIIDGGGAVITTGQKGHIQIPVKCTITAVRLLADQAGTIQIDIWKDTYANFPPTVADTITASAKPALASAQSYQDTALTGWTVAVAAGDILAYNVDVSPAPATLTRVVVSLSMVRS